MALAQTKAASFIQEHSEEISSHQIISLLMDGALERIDQAMEAFNKSEAESFQVLVNKLVAIVNGLKNCLDMDAGGEIAENLDSLYDYMIQKLMQTPICDLFDVLVEVKGLIKEIKTGWDTMDLNNLELVATP